MTYLYCSKLFTNPAVALSCAWEMGKDGWQTEVFQTRHGRWAIRYRARQAQKAPTTAYDESWRRIRLVGLVKIRKAQTGDMEARGICLHTLASFPE